MKRLKQRFVAPVVVTLSSLLVLSTIAPVSVVLVKGIELNNPSSEISADTQKVIDLTFPSNDGNVHILKPNIVKYIAAMHQQASAIENDYVLHDFYVSAPDWQNRYGEEFTNETDLVRVADFYNPSVNEQKSKEVALCFNHKGFPENSVFTVTYGLDSSLSDGVSIETTENYVTINNLLAAQKYYWKVTSGGFSSDIQSFNTDEGFRMITSHGVANIRDMGGRPVLSNKRIKQGLIFRGAELVEEAYGTHSKTLFDDTKELLQDELGIKYEIDLRGDDEANNITESPLKDENHSDVEYIRIANIGAYDRFFSMKEDDERWPIIKQAFLAFKNANEKHVYFHCWGGADRTGTVGFLLGGLLGMSYTDLVIDFELTSFSKNYRPHNKNDGDKVYRFPSLIYRCKTEKAKNGDKQPYFEEGKTISDIIKDILIDRAGLTEQDIIDIKNNLLEDR